MDLFQCSISLLTLMISFSRITNSKGTPNVIDARAQSIYRGVHNGLAFAKSKAHRFSYLNITSLGTDYVFNGKECGLACVNISSCFSYNLAAFDDISGRTLCELLPSDKYNNSDNFTSSQLFHHFSIVSPCMSGPCQNGGSCVSVYKENSYVCLCTKGYTGSICQTDIDDCASNPCKNNGTCSDRVNGFNCSCAPGFHGSLCEKDIDDCASHPCKNNGTCTDQVNGFNCTCAPGFNGTQCETDIDDCASHPCKNNGTCTDRVNGFNCSCAPGFNGTQCETDIDDCASHPCKNNGTCTDRVNGFSCSCAPGSDGLQCETADICQNYKTLADAERRYDHVTVNFKCDRTLNGWYRFQGAAGETMVTKCPPLGRCGAEFPAWLSEGHPPAAEGIVTRNVCIHGDKGCCDKSVLIQVKNCRSYYIYKLTPPVMCNTRYCSVE